MYYGSEFGIEGRKERFSDDSLRPALKYEEYQNAIETNPCTKLIAALGKICHKIPALCYGEYKELLLQTTHFAYARILDGKSVIITVNNADQEAVMNLRVGDCAEYIGALTGEKISVNGGRIQVKVGANSGEIWIPEEIMGESFAPISMSKIEKTEVPKKEVTGAVEPTVERKTEKVTVNGNKSYEDMTIEELQEAILEKMRKNGPVTDYMLGTVRENTHKGSLITWVKSFV